jgi:hypothetical protein
MKKTDAALHTEEPQRRWLTYEHVELLSKNKWKQGARMLFRPIPLVIEPLRFIFMVV